MLTVRSRPLRSFGRAFRPFAVDHADVPRVTTDLSKSISGPSQVPVASAGDVGAGRVEVESITRIVSPFEIAERLKVSPDEESVLERRNHYYADDEAIQVVTTYLRWTDAAGTSLLEPQTGPGGIYGRLEDRGHTMDQRSGRGHRPDGPPRRSPHPSHAARRARPGRAAHQLRSTRRTLRGHPLRPPS
jgi:UTRA domain